MHKWIGIVLSILVLWVVAIAYLYSIALRNAGIIEGRMALRMAAKEYAEHGYVTNYGARGYQVWLSSNAVSIRGTQYWCFITTTNAKFYDEGALALTTNREFIWLDNTRPPKLIGTNYRARLFPPGF
jgi:hypothetical protein